MVQHGSPYIPCQGFLSTFIRRLITGQPLEIYGDGAQLRDPLDVDDAVAAFLRAGAAPAVPSTTYNVGGPEALALRSIAEIAVGISGRSYTEMRPFPTERKQIDIGSYCSDWSRIRKELGWTPHVQFAGGLRSTLEFYAVKWRIIRSIPRTDGVPWRNTQAGRGGWSMLPSGKSGRKTARFMRIPR